MPGSPKQRTRRRRDALRLSWLLALLGALALVLAACGGAGGAGGAAVARQAASTEASGGAVAVSPEPGTPDASPQTQISFLGPYGTKVTSIHVSGSRSGAHGGVLRAYSTGTGESFLPSRAFTPGESVRVSATVSAGGSSRALSSSFTVAQQASVSQKEFPNNRGNASEVQHYATLPGVAPSSVRITMPARPGAAPGYLFLAPYQGTGTPGVMIAEQDGALVWFHALAPAQDATNFRAQEFEGKQVLTWWQGRILEVGFGQGEDEIYGADYRHLATVRAGNGYRADLHEFRLTPQGTAWIDMFDPIRMNLSRYGGPANGVLTDSVVQEIDVKTGLVMWEWHALGHISISESHKPVPHEASYPWDWVHVNSVDPGSSGDVLLSSRSTWTIYDVSLSDGAIRWRLGGNRSSFQMGAGTRFYWQHDAEWQEGGLISVFDNGSSPPEEKQSRGLLLDPNLPAHRVTLVKALTNPYRTLLASSQGNVLSLPGGRWMVGYGGLPNFTEFDASGHVLLDGTLGHNVQDFRTYFGPWSGQAPGSPSVAARRFAHGMTVQVSWNGATSVASWRVLAGSSAGSLSPVRSAPRSGFQTQIALASVFPYVQVQALDASGSVIGSSPVVRG